MAINLEELKTRKFDSEDKFQAASLLLISQQFPRLRDKMWHTKNELWIRRIAIETPQGWRVETDDEFEKRKIREGAKYKAMGLKAGIMDWLFLLNGILYKLELKQPDGVVSDVQEEVIIAFDKDCPQIPVVVARNLYVVYMFCKWICEQDLKINFPQDFKKFQI